jgi:site-specific recombinase XerD
MGKEAVNNAAGKSKRISRVTFGTDFLKFPQFPLVMFLRTLYVRFMSAPPGTPSDGRPASPARQHFLQLMYGSGLRLMETLRLRVKDLDFDQGTIAIHDGKGSKHRVVPLPCALEEHLKTYLATVREKHLQDLAIGLGETHIPEALKRKYPRAAAEWAWQYIFAAANVCAHPRTGHIARHHLHEHSLQRQFKEAVRKAQIPKMASCHCMRKAYS